MTKKIARIERFRPASCTEQREAPVNIDVPAELQSIFDKTPLLNLEDSKPYWALLRRFAQEIRPGDTTEWLWVKDVVDDSWKIIFFRRIVASLIDVGQRAAIFEIFAPDGYASNVYEKREARKRAEEWCDAKTRKEVEAHLKRVGLDNDAVMAVSFSNQVAAIEAAERMLAAAELRRNDRLYEIENRRQRFGHALRQASDKIIDAESPVIASRQETKK